MRIGNKESVFSRAKTGKVLVLLVLMVAVALSAAFAAEAVGYYPASGTCGENITWALDPDTGVLTFTGSGEMNFGDYPAWRDCRRDATSIVISDGITTIGRGAFSNFDKVKTVSWPESITVIGDNAFSNCKALEEITFGKNITEIGDAAFRECSVLKELTIPGNVKTVGRSAFSGCRGIQSLTLEEGITTIEDDAFAFCVSLTGVIVPDSVMELGGSAFSQCSKLSNVTIGQGVTVLRNHVFGNCISLTSYTIPDTIQEIESYAFSYCSGLKEVVIGAGVSKIDTTSFWHCDNLEVLSVSSANQHFSTDRGVLYNKNKTTLVTMPQGFAGDYEILPGTKEIAEYGLYECEKLTGLTIPEGITALEKYVFCHCSSLKEVVLPNSLRKIDHRAFGWAGFESIRLPADLERIESSAFDNCKVKEITFTGEPPWISDDAFSSVNATVYYPGADPLWKDAQHLYGGILHWEKLLCTGSHVEVPAKDKKATCIKEGAVGGTRCAVCGQGLAAQTIIPMTEHSYGGWVTIHTPTENAYGLAQRICAVCKNKEDKGLPKLTPEVTTPPATQPTQPPATEPTAPPVTEPTVPETEPSVPETTQPASLPEVTEPSTQAPTMAETTEPVQDTNREGERSEPDVLSIITAVVVVLAVASVAGAAVMIILKRKK